MLINSRSPTLVLPQLIFSPYPHLPIVCSPLTLLIAKVLSKSPLQSHSTMSFAASTILWPPRRANSTEAPLVSKTAVSFGNPYIHLPSSLPSFLSPSPSLFYISHQPLLPPISLTENKLTHTKRLQTWVGAGDNMKNIAYARKVDIEAPRKLIVRPTSNQTNSSLFLLPPSAPPIPQATDSLLQASLGRCTQRWLSRYFFSFFFYHHFAFLNLIHIFLYLIYLISFLFFSFLFFSFLFISFLFISFYLFRLIVL